MRKLKWTAFVVIVAMIIVTALYLRRDFIARELANSALGGSDLEVAELSVRSLGVSRVEMSRLVIVSGGGDRFEIRGLSVPLGLSDVGTNEISADRIDVEFGSGPAEREALSGAVRKLLAVPSQQPDIVVSMDTIALPDVPVVRNAVWSTIGDGQNAGFEIDGHALEISVDSDATGGYRMTLQSGAGELGAELAITDLGERIELSGDLSARVGDWLPTLRTLLLLPQDIETIEAEFAGTLSIALDTAAAGEITVDGTLSLIDGAGLSRVTAADSRLRVDASSATTIDARFEYPSLDWTLTSASIDGLVTTDDGSFPLLLNDLRCRSGIRCTMYATIYGEDLSWADYSVDTASIASPIALESAGETRVDIPPSASVVLTGLRVGEVTAASAEVVSFSGAEVQIGAGWRGSVGELRVAIDRLEATAALIASGELGMAELTIADSGETVDAAISLAPGATAAYGGLNLTLPGLSGTVIRRGNELRSALVVRDASVEAGIDLVRDFGTGAGSMSIRDGRVSFDQTRLSDYVDDWPFEWDLLGGVLTADASLDWRSDDSGLRYRIAVAADLQKLSGRYEDYAFVGVASMLRATLDSIDGIAVEPSSLSVALVDVGLPVENVTADYRADVGNREVFVENLAMDALGGRITAAPFTYSLDADSNVVRFTAHAVQLGLIADLADFEALDMSGSISGEIPVTIGTDSIGVDGGRLASDNPGGVVRYASGAVAGSTPSGNLALVRRALSNFEFDTLTSSVDYDPEGNLVLRTRLSGINPEMDPNQPVILNVNVDTNVPQMLRSLRAIRTIEDILEERTAE